MRGGASARLRTTTKKGMLPALRLERDRKLCNTQAKRRQRTSTEVNTSQRTSTEVITSQRTSTEVKTSERLVLDEETPSTRDRSAGDSDATRRRALPFLPFLQAADTTATNRSDDCW